jgi:hypothetical protein
VSEGVMKVSAAFTPAEVCGAAATAGATWFMAFLLVQRGRQSGPSVGATDVGATTCLRQ